MQGSRALSGQDGSSAFLDLSFLTCAMGTPTQHPSQFSTSKWEVLVAGGWGWCWDRERRGRLGRQALTLAVLAVLVASHGVHAVAGGAVGGRAVRLRGGQAVSRLDGVRPLAAAGRNGGGGVQAAV